MTQIVSGILMGIYIGSMITLVWWLGDKFTGAENDGRYWTIFMAAAAAANATYLTLKW